MYADTYRDEDLRRISQRYDDITEGYEKVLAYLKDPEKYSREDVSALVEEILKKIG